MPPRIELDIDPCDHITSDAIGKPGQRVFYIQAFRAEKTYTVIIEKTTAFPGDRRRKIFSRGGVPESQPRRGDIRLHRRADAHQPAGRPDVPCG